MPYFTTIARKGDTHLTRGKFGELPPAVMFRTAKILAAGNFERVLRTSYSRCAEIVFASQASEETRYTL